MLWIKVIFPCVKDAWLPVTLTGVLRPPTVVPWEDVIDIPETVTLASPDNELEPIVKSNWSSAAKTITSPSICNEKLPCVKLAWDPLTATVTSVNAVSLPIEEVKDCPVTCTEKLSPQANSPHSPLPQPSPVKIVSSTVAAPICVLKTEPVTGTPIPTTVLPTPIDIVTGPGSLTNAEVPATEVPMLDDNDIPETLTSAFAVTDSEPIDDVNDMPLTETISSERSPHSDAPHVFRPHPVAISF